MGKRSSTRGPLDFSTFKKVGGTSKYTEMQDANGNWLRIKHSSISPAFVKQLRTLPFQKFAKGGFVQSEEELPEADSPSMPEEFSSAEPLADETVDFSEGLVEGAPGAQSAAETIDDMALTQVPPGEMVPPEPLSQQTPVPPPDGGDGSELAVPGIDKVRTLGQQAQNLEVGEAQRRAQQEAGVLDEMARDAEERKNAAKGVYDQIETLRGELKANQDKIDPNRLWNNLSTGRKVGALLGIIVAGAGAGAKGENPALKVLDDVIAQDIKAQQANMGQKNTLLKYNMELLQDKQAAVTLLRAQAADMFAAKLKKAALDVHGKAAKANALRTAQEVEKWATDKYIDIAKVVGKQRLQQQKALEAQQAQEKADALAIEGAENIDRLTKDALDVAKRSHTSTGIAGAIARNFNPESDSIRLASKIKTIKSVLGLDKIQALRAASKTGAGLGGQTSDRDIDMLQASLANLDQWQPRDELIKNLEVVRNQYQGIIKNIRAAHGGQRPKGAVPPLRQAGGKQYRQVKR